MAQVRLFAGAADAVGVSETLIEAATTDALLTARPPCQALRRMPLACSRNAAFSLMGSRQHAPSLSPLTPASTCSPRLRVPTGTGVLVLAGSSGRIDTSRVDSWPVAGSPRWACGGPTVPRPRC